MSPRSRAMWRTSTLLDLLFPALTITFGLQMLRVFIPSLVLHRRAASAPAEFGAVLYGAFLLAFLAPLLPRLLGTSRALIVSAASVSLIRVLMQLVHNVDARIWIAAAGVLAFLWFAPIYLGYSRGSKRLLNFGLVLLIGIALDTTLHGLFGTYDYAWVIDAGTIALAAGLTLIQLALLRRFVRAVEPAGEGSGRFASAAPLLGIGLILLFHALALQNIARFAALRESTVQEAFFAIALGNAAGLSVGVLAQTSDTGLRRWWVFLATVVLLFDVIVLRVSPNVTGYSTYAAIAVLLVQIGSPFGAPGDRPGLLNTSFGWAFGMLGFVVPLTIFYLAYDTILPFENDVIFPIAAVAVGAAALASTRADADAQPVDRDWTPAWLALALVVAPILTLVARPAPTLAQDTDAPARVMSYNIHMGFDVDGWLDLETLAQTIESSGANVVALQEVPRGWYINASVDALEWLAQRLNMVYVFGSAADPMWGNAIMSRYPIRRNPYTVPLPEGNMRPRRSLTSLEISAGHTSFVVIVTHLDHHGDSQARRLQIPAVIDEYNYESWRDRPRVVLGDMNATPDSVEIQLFREAGLRDAYLLSGGDPGAGSTYRADHPSIRIDYIWLSPDLAASEFQVLESTASDHLGIAVTVGR